MVNKEREALVEKVARALAESDNNVWEDMGPRMPDAYRANAQAAISTILSALQEPTQEMIDAYFDRCRNLGIFTHINANAAWRAMINASPLGEQSE